MKASTLSVKESAAACFLSAGLGCRTASSSSASAAASLLRWAALGCAVGVSRGTASSSGGVARFVAVELVKGGGLGAGTEGWRERVWDDLRPFL